MRHTDPGSYDPEELETSILRGRLDVDLLRARAWCDDAQAQCMYAQWLLHRAQEPLLVDDPDGLVEEARAWLRRAMRGGSLHAARAVRLLER